METGYREGILRLIDELRRAKEPDVLQAIAFLESTGIRFNSVLEEVMDVVLEAIRWSEGEWGGEANGNGNGNGEGNGMNSWNERRENRMVNWNGRRNEWNGRLNNNRMNDRMNNRMNERMNNQMNDRMNNRMNNQMNNRMNNQMNHDRMNQSHSLNPLNPLNDWSHRADRGEALAQGEPLNELHPVHSIAPTELNESQPNRDQVQIPIESADSFTSNDPLLHNPQLDSIRPMWDGSIRGIPALNPEVTERVRGEGESELERRFFELLEEALQEERFQRR